MANKIKLRRGNKATLPTLDEGELVFVKDEKSLYVGTSTGNKSISTDAEKNVQSDWNQTNAEADDFILNKPSIPGSTYKRTVDSGDSWPGNPAIKLISITGTPSANSIRGSVIFRIQRRPAIGAIAASNREHLDQYFYLTYKEGGHLIIRNDIFQLKPIHREVIDGDSGYKIWKEVIGNTTSYYLMMHQYQRYTIEIVDYTSISTGTVEYISDTTPVQPSFNYSGLTEVSVSLGLFKSAVTKLNNLPSNLATKLEAEAGVDNTTIMTPLRVLESIQANVSISGGYAPDEDTIVLNENDELESTNVMIWRYE